MAFNKLLLKELPRIVKSRDGTLKGEPTGGTRKCQLQGCNGKRIGVRWEDGVITWPCSKGWNR